MRGSFFFVAFMLQIHFARDNRHYCKSFWGRQGDFCEGVGSRDALDRALEKNLFLSNVRTKSYLGWEKIFHVPVRGRALCTCGYGHFLSPTIGESPRFVCEIPARPGRNFGYFYQKRRKGCDQPLSVFSPGGRAIWEWENKVY